MEREAVATTFAPTTTSLSSSWSPDHRRRPSELGPRASSRTITEAGLDVRSLATNSGGTENDAKQKEEINLYGGNAQPASRLGAHGAQNGHTRGCVQRAYVHPSSVHGERERENPEKKYIQANNKERRRRERGAVRACTARQGLGASARPRSFCRGSLGRNGGRRGELRAGPT